MDPKHLNFLAFLKKSTTVYHAAEEIMARCKKAGFIELDEKARWNLVPKQGYFITRGNSLVAAFQTPKKIPTSAVLLATHIDSPCLKLKPKPEQIQNGISELCTEVYGAPLLHTWMDRDLLIAGKVTFLDKSQKIHSKTVCFPEHPVMIPSIALHLDRGVGDKGVLIHRQEHLKAIFSLHAKEKTFEKWLETECKAQSLLGFDLFLVPSESPTLLGESNELLSAAKLDNLTSAYAACVAIVEAKAETNLLQMALFFDHEEIGSVSAVGADSFFVEHLLERIALGLNLDKEDLYRMKSSSLCISGDLAHGIHPNFLEKFDLQNTPELGKGVVFKYNANQKYATNSMVAAPLLVAAKKHKIPTQTFACRSDIPSGSTIGSMLAANTGIATIDVGISSWAMHSIRETIAMEDEISLCKLFHLALVEEK